MQNEIAAKYQQLTQNPELFSVMLSKPGTKHPMKPWKDVKIAHEKNVRVPVNCGLGLLTGIRDDKEYGILAIDIDVPDNKPEHYYILNGLVVSLPRKFQELSTTSQCRTPSGGYHFYLKTKRHIGQRTARDDIQITSKIGIYALPIDIRADGGFIMIPPSPYPGSDTKIWKNEYKGNIYEEVIELCAENVQEASDELVDFILSEKSLIFLKEDELDMEYEVEIRPDADKIFIEEPVQTEIESDADYYGFVRNEICLVEVLNKLKDENFGVRQDWLDTTLALIHVFGDYHGGSVTMNEFIYNWNKRCEVAANALKTNNYDKLNNATKVAEFWEVKRDKQFGFGHLVKRLKKDNADYDKWVNELNKKDLYIFKIEDISEKYKDFGDIYKITTRTVLSEVLAFFKATIRYVVSGGSVTVFTRQLNKGIRSLPGIKYVKKDELDRYYQWVKIQKSDLMSTLADYSIIIGKNGKNKDKFMKLSDIFKMSENRTEITFKTAEFMPQSINIMNGVDTRLIEQSKMFGSFNFAPSFRARVKYTREEALNNPGCQFLDNHLRKVLANDNEDAYKYLTGYLAHMVQFPHILTGTMVTFRDVHNGGTGKSCFAMLISAMLGNLAKIYATLGDYQHKFEIDKPYKIFIWIDELNSDNADISKFKSSITNPNSEIEAKFASKKEEENFNNIWAASNNTKILDIKPREARRFAIFDVNKSYSKNDEYINKLINIDQDGLDAYFSYLISIDIENETNFRTGRGFVTDARTDLEAAAICSTDRLFLDIISGELNFNSPNCRIYVHNQEKWIEFHTSVLREKYVEHYMRSGMQILDPHEFSGKLVKLFGKSYRIRLNKKQQVGYKISFSTIIEALKNHLGEILYEHLTVGDEDEYKYEHGYEQGGEPEQEYELENDREEPIDNIIVDDLELH